MNKHNCFECFESDSVATNDTKHIVKGHCSICMSRMIKIYRYQGTYERAGFKKLDPVPDVVQFKRKDINPIRITEA